MIRLVIFALALTVFCKLFLNQEDAPTLDVEAADAADEHTRELAKDSPTSPKTLSPKS
ncbi:hypothetical protein [Litoribrevibacter albus]|uniref:Uncharacterized protein n=1 Tax=Litoribrevibacter albus TaxID=1473156 RepID=A0AA37S8N8_9GAMM|nr:hypothetical protein [Litoribrevibacter albus]GLQ30212.1 hypothetical protein GCM10007876_06900 [Litoribrevibacter albus]